MFPTPPSHRIAGRTPSGFRLPSGSPQAASAPPSSPPPAKSSKIRLYGTLARRTTPSSDRRGNLICGQGRVEVIIGMGKTHIVELSGLLQKFAQLTNVAHVFKRKDPVD